MPTEKSAGAVVFHKGPAGKIEYLLLKHSDKYWNFPKGHIEKGETEMTAAKREITEETGLKDLTAVHNFKTVERYFYRAFDDFHERKGKTHIKPKGKGKIVSKFVTFYLVKSRDKDVKISHEHQDYEWLSFEEAMERLKRYKGSKEVLRRANACLTKKK
ncbi:MAG: NUDIX domain-containing protein [Candidatus Staskawiczbacteria bacterium]|jgi:8-oxo-dGTP pyrophosphatase MutT (NUDIX family)